MVIMVIIIITVPVSRAPRDVERRVVIRVEVIITLRGAAVARREAAADRGALGKIRTSVEISTSLSWHRP